MATNQLTQQATIIIGSDVDASISSTQQSTLVISANTGSELDVTQQTALVIGSNSAPTARMTQQALVIIHEPPNLPPIQDTGFVARSFNVVKNGVLNGSGLLNHIIDPESGPVTVNTTPVVDVSHGVLSLDTGGTFTYTPGLDYVGSDSFIYAAEDAQGKALNVNVNLVVSELLIISGMPPAPVDPARNHPLPALPPFSRKMRIIGEP